MALSDEFQITANDYYTKFTSATSKLENQKVLAYRRRIDEVTEVLARLGCCWTTPKKAPPGQDKVPPGKGKNENKGKK
jgi:hypothetical protein